MTTIAAIIAAISIIAAPFCFCYSRETGGVVTKILPIVNIWHAAAAVYMHLIIAFIVLVLVYVVICHGFYSFGLIVT